MRPKKQPATPRERDAGQIQIKELFQTDLTPGVLEKPIKNWAINKLAENHFEGKRSSEHRLAKVFWAKCGRRLKNV